MISVFVYKLYKRKLTHIMNEEENVDNALTVSDLTELIKNALKINFDKTLCVVGEMSNYKLSKNNVFFTLKDEDATISVIMWNYGVRKDKPDLDEGKKVKVYGRLTVFNKSGSYNLTAFKIELLGIGDLYQEYMTLKKKYTDLGYFDETKKKQLPLNINRIGIITALDGAALQDFLYVLKKNNFCGEVNIKSCIVQGKDCPKSVSACLKELNQLNLDVIVVARGGGSFEDLFGFSDKEIIEALHNMKTCTISAIGHEIDFMLSDYAADIRAPTPSIAGEIISCKKEGQYDIEEINEIRQKLVGLINSKITIITYEINNIKLISPKEIIDKLNNHIDVINIQINNRIKNKINTLDSKLNDIMKIFNKSDNPATIMSKGYGVIYTFPNSTDNILYQVTSIKDLKKIKKLKIKLIDGEAIIEIKNIKIE
jgi:exodeoxyribonuclease VII large subunit